MPQAQEYTNGCKHNHRRISLGVVNTLNLRKSASNQTRFLSGTLNFVICLFLLGLVGPFGGDNVYVGWTSHKFKALIFDERAILKLHTIHSDFTLRPRNFPSKCTRIASHCCREKGNCSSICHAVYVYDLRDKVMNILLQPHEKVQNQLNQVQKRLVIPLVDRCFQ